MDNHGDLSLCMSYFLGFGFRKDSKVLDIGTQYGSFIKSIDEFGYKDSCGIDSNYAYIQTGADRYKFISDRLIFYEGNIIPFEDKTFDVVTMFDTIEHIADPKKYMTEVARVLKPGGFFVFQTPNKYTNIPWEVLWNKNLRSWKKYHPSLQTSRSIVSLLCQSGFFNVKVHNHKDAPGPNQIRLIKSKLGLLGVLLLVVISFLPVGLCPSIWGHATKKEY